MLRVSTKFAVLLSVVVVGFAELGHPKVAEAGQWFDCYPGEEWRDCCDQAGNDLDTEYQALGGLMTAANEAYDAYEACTANCGGLYAAAQTAVNDLYDADELYHDRNVEWEDQCISDA